MRLNDHYDKTEMKPATALALKESENRADAGWIVLGKSRELPLIYLYPGSIFVSHTPCAVTTVLGSCVAVCMWDAKLGIGGANHFLLPYQTPNAEGSTRFGDIAMQQLVEKLLALGCQLRRLQAKLFGGASVVKAFRDSEDLLGAQNAQAAREFLSAYNIPIVTHDLGGRQGRKVIFHSNDGAAWVKRL